MANGKVVANTYDAIGRISSKKIGSYTTTLSYLAGINGSQTERLASYKNGSDNAYQYTYDANGNITHIQQGTNHVYYQYDALNQLVREDNSTTGKSVVYTYDANGNILSKSEHAYVANGGELGEATNTILYGYEAEHQNWADQLTSYNGEAIRYDGIGNPTTYRGYTMSWLGRRLTSASGNGNTLSYTYDENGLRAQKTVNGTATQYRYHGTVLLSQVRGNDKLLFSYDVNGDVVSVNFNGTYYYYLRNAQGDIVKIIDGNNNSVVEYTYDSWGKVLSCTGSLSSTLGAQNPFRYRGYVYDEETGFYYLQSRYYDPETGRFLNSDSYISTGQGILGNNMFAYCLNNPVNRIDFLGNLSNYIGSAAVMSGIEALIALENSGSIVAEVDKNSPPGEAEGYKAPKGGARKVKNPNGSGKGWLDKKGNVWVPGKMHGGEGWTVQYPNGGHHHVYPGGHVRGYQSQNDTGTGVLIMIGSGILLAVLALDNSTGFGMVDDGAIPQTAAAFMIGWDMVAQDDSCYVCLEERYLQ